MKRDLYIDNNIASKFSNPQDKEYIKLTKWLLNFDVNDTKNKDQYAHLMVSQKLLTEYLRSSQNSKSNTSIPIIINKLLSEGRLIIISNDAIKKFRSAYFTKAIEKRLRCNEEDRNHIPLVLLSDRKYALAYDISLTHDLKKFPGFTVFVEKRPEKLPYDK